MKSIILIVTLSLVSGCATVKSADEQREQVRQCIREIKTSDDNLKDAFEVCRQIYGLKKVKEHR